ncbi:MAG: MerR family transcriptional regulator [Candidatus Auribacterota bacterium]|jgi:DNA-binding transcriptional MerR regulator|nr:MerR family transcriptional regulator [Candidatus Auribacterota bacterium]
MVKIPEKMYYTIKEASEITDTPSHVLRFWETEFEELKPRKSKSGRRMYRMKDLDLIVEIKQLLYIEQYTIPGARRFMQLKKERKLRISADHTATTILHELKLRLAELKNEIRADKNNLA